MHKVNVYYPNLATKETIFIVVKTYPIQKMLANITKIAENIRLRVRYGMQTMER
jgi:hypothetical protein